MTTASFPQYRWLSGSDALYCIEGPKHCMEWQPLGEEGWVVHKHFAHDYPTQVWLSELLNAEGHVGEISASEWSKRWRKRAVRNQVTPIGRSMAPPSDEDVPFLSAVNLAEHTTFGVAASSKFWCETTCDNEIRSALALARRRSLSVLILGGGSNVLFHGDWNGLCLHVGVRGHEVIEDDGNHLKVTVGAGENWHEWVLFALKQGWNGLENLALIPGSVGAAPMQNIGAYGVELQDRFVWLEAIHRETGALKRFTKAMCAFGYRESVFKQEERDQWVIVRVTFELERSAATKISYGAIQEALPKKQLGEISHQEVAEAVMQIRRSKLPDPAILGNAGSFFKNPVIDALSFQNLLSQHPEVVHYPLENGEYKLAAGWLIEQAGWKGYRSDKCGVHDRQALVLVNFGGATGMEIWKLANAIIQDIEEKFGVTLQPEVNQIFGA